MFRLLLLCALGTAPAGWASPPNILLLVADDLGWSDVGFNGGKDIPTPHLDRLASQGVRLTDFRACPMCSPTRAGLLTGRYPHRFGMMRAVVPPWSTYGLPKSERTLPELLDPKQNPTLKKGVRTSKQSGSTFLVQLLMLKVLLMF